MIAANKLFDTYEHTEEQDMMEDLIIESIGLFGMNMYYLPKDTQNLDYLYGQDTGTTRYSSATEIQMYLKENESFEGQGAFIEQFGMQFEQQTVFTVAMKVFEDKLPDMKRPKEGDLLWFPLNKTMFEIQYVEHESIFYQLGKLYTYDLQCELFQFSNEIFETGIDEIDSYGLRIAQGREVQLMDDGTTDYEIGEWVYQGDSFDEATIVGRVKEWNNEEHIVTLVNLSGTPANNERLIGRDSGAEWTVNIEDVDEFEMDTGEESDNVEFEEEAKEYISYEDKEFDERSPFGDF